MKIRLFFLISLVFLISCGLLFGETHGIALGVKAASLGFEGEVTVRILKSLNLRLVGSYLPFDFQGGIPEVKALASRVGYTLVIPEAYQMVEDLGIEITLGLQLLSGMALVDFHPLGGSFHLSGGVAYNANHLVASIEPTQDLVMGPVTFAKDRVGGLSGEISFDPLAWYGGIGLGNPVRQGKRVGFSLDLGLLYHNAPYFDLEAMGMFAPTAAQDTMVQERLAQYVEYHFFPVVSLGMTFQF